VIQREGYRVIQALVFAFLLSIGGAFGSTHTVLKSETFYSIAKKYGVSLSSLMAANDVQDPRLLQIGQKLKIPTSSSVESARTQPQKKSLRIVIDPGHGGKDRGAVWGGVKESDLNLKVALKVEKDLKARGYTVIMTRRSDVFVSLEQRAKLANRYSNSIVVSIHFNASTYTSVRGAETYYAGTKGKYLAQSIQKEMVKNLKVRDRGIIHRKFSILRQTAYTAVLAECGFISNSYERSRCVTSSYQTAAARAIVAGIERYDRTY